MTDAFDIGAGSSGSKSLQIFTNIKLINCKFSNYDVHNVFILCYYLIMFLVAYFIEAEDSNGPMKSRVIKFGLNKAAIDANRNEFENLTALEHGLERAYNNEEITADEFRTAWFGIQHMDYFTDAATGWINGYRQRKNSGK